MTDLVPTADIERIVGARRHRKVHQGRVVSAEHTVYILHSCECLDSGIDLRQCPFSLALDEGIDMDVWAGIEDVATWICVYEGRVVPFKGAAECRDPVQPKRR